MCARICYNFFGIKLWEVKKTKDNNFLSTVLASTVFLFSILATLLLYILWQFVNEMFNVERPAD